MPNCSHRSARRYVLEVPRHRAARLPLPIPARRSATTSGPHWSPRVTSTDFHSAT
jgi:hypothetical protein